MNSPKSGIPVVLDLKLIVADFTAVVLVFIARLAVLHGHGRYCGSEGNSGGLSMDIFFCNALLFVVTENGCGVSNGFSN